MSTPRTVVITGAAQGLGKCLALEFAARGDQVVGLCRSDDVAAGCLRTELANLGTRSSMVLECDVSRENEPVWDRVRGAGTGAFVLINNAFSTFQPQPFHMLKWEDFEMPLNTGVKGSWLSSRALLRSMVKRREGTIVTVLSTATHDLPPKGFAAYVTAKHAQRGLILAMASEYSQLGLRIFSVSPGFMNTNLTSRWDTKILAAVASARPPSDPIEVARRIVVLTDSATTPGRGEDYGV
jgi:3-oxoacyl-[acyl-carrier protein] reductase